MVLFLEHPIPILLVQIHSLGKAFSPIVTIRISPCIVREEGDVRLACQHGGGNLVPKANEQRAQFLGIDERVTGAVVVDIQAQHVGEYSVMGSLLGPQTNAQKKPSNSSSPMAAGLTRLSSSSSRA